MSTPFKMRSGNSPLNKDKTSWKEFFGKVKKDPMILPKTFGKSLKEVYVDTAKKIWKKHGPVINPSTKNPRGIGK